MTFFEEHPFSSAICCPDCRTMPCKCKPRVENFGPSLPDGKYRIWKLWHMDVDKPWCLTAFLGTYRFATFEDAVAYMDELASPYERIDGDGTPGGLLQ